VTCRTAPPATHAAARWCCGLLGVAISLGTAGAGADEIHRWTAADGTVHFGDRPPASATTTLVTVKPNVYTSPSIQQATSDLNVPGEVVLYSAEWCGYCKQARRYFTDNGIRFTEYDVEKSAKGQRDFKKLRAKGVPVILVGDRRLNGFSANAFRQLYGPGEPDT